jgi:hypothetical protein
MGHLSVLGKGNVRFKSQADIYGAKCHVCFTPNSVQLRTVLQFSSKGEIALITAVVTFKLPPEMSREKWQENIKQVSVRFQNVPGLIRKQFLYNDKGIGGGVYLWETREAAENCYYKSPWAENVRRASGGNEPEIAWFETGVVVDNESHQVKTAT